MRTALAVVLIAAALLLAPAVATTARAAETPIVTGQNWQNATPDQKKAFLVGMGTILSLEHQLQGNTVSASTRSLVPTFTQGLRGMTYDQIVTYLDDYYASHPDQISRPVVEVLFDDLAVPRAQQAASAPAFQ